MKFFLHLTFLLIASGSNSQEMSAAYKPNQSELQKADSIIQRVCGEECRETCYNQ